MEAELLAPIPRPVPDSIARHDYRRAKQARTRRISLVFLLLSGLGLVFQESNFMHTLGLYFTPFSQFYWVGWIFVAISVWGVFHFRHPWQKDAYRYLRQGIPVVGRVFDLRMEVASRVNGADSTFAYDVYLEFLNPHSGELNVTAIRSPEFANGARLKCRVGDYLTAIYLPGQLPETLTLYGFTDTNPDADLLDYPDPSGARKALLAIVLGLGMLGWGLARYPVSVAYWGWLLALSSPLILAGGAAGYYYYRRRARERDEQQRLAVEQGSVMAGSTLRGPSRPGYILLGLFCGGFLGLAALAWLNGALDFRQPDVTTVEVKRALCTTHQAIFKTYSVEYIDPRTGKEEKAGVSPHELEGARSAELCVYRGALGLPWEKVHLKP